MSLTEQGARLRRDVIWNLAPVVLLGVVGLGLSFAVAAWWGPAAYAVFNLVTTAYFAFAVIGTCGLQYSVLRAVAERSDDRDRVAAVVVGALVPSVVLAALATAAFLALRPVIADWLDSEGVARGMTWAAPGLFCFSINKLLFGIVNGMRRMRVLAIYTSLRYLMIAGGLGLARATDIDADHLAGIWTFTEVGTMVVLTCELLATVDLRRGAGWRAWVKVHVDYGLRGVLATLAFELNTKLDVWMLGVVVADKAAIGVYALAAALNEGVAQLANVVQNNLDPIIARLFADRDTDELRALVRRIRRWFIPAMIAICAISAAAFPLVIPPMIGNPAFEAGTIPFAIFMLGTAIASPYLPFAHLLLMAKRPGWHTCLLIAAFVFNVAGSMVLIPRFGVSGAACSMAATTVVSALLMRLLARSRLGLRI